MAATVKILLQRGYYGKNTFPVVCLRRHTYSRWQTTLSSTYHLNTPYFASFRTDLKNRTCVLASLAKPQICRASGRWALRFLIEQCAVWLRKPDRAVGRLGTTTGGNNLQQLREMNEGPLDDDPIR